MEATINELDQRLKVLEKTCCSVEAIRNNAELNYKVQSMMTEIHLLNKTVNNLQKVIYVAIGVYGAVQFIGIHNIMKAIG